MKKILIAVVIGLLLVAALATTALADNGPHGGFTATTDACAGCHRAHSARDGGNDLLRMPETELCMSCHKGGLGASTDVSNGIYTTDAQTGTHAEGVSGAGLFGGGFDNTVMTTSWNGSSAGATVAAAAGSRATTSTHTLDTANQTIWGSGANNGTTAEVSDTSGITLECTSCHDPHGTAGYTNTATPAFTPISTGLTNACDYTKAYGGTGSNVGSATNPCTVKIASYRLLRWQPQGSNGFTIPTADTLINWSGGDYPTNGTAAGATTGWTVPDNFATNGGEWYTLGTGSKAAPNDYLPGGSLSNAYKILANDNGAGNTAHDYSPAAINAGFFCAQCHDRYFNNSALRNNGDKSTYCLTDEDNTTLVSPAAPTYTTSSSDVGGASPTNPQIFPVGQVYPEVQGTAKQAYCKAVVSYNSHIAAPGITVAWGDSRPSGDAVYEFRHASGDVRAAVDGSGTLAGNAFTSIGRTCLTCHVSHGTSAVANSNLTDGVDPGAQVNLATIATSNLGGSLHGGSVLLRMDGRTLCIRCHGSDVGFVSLVP